MNKWWEVKELELRHASCFGKCGAKTCPRGGLSWPRGRFRRWPVGVGVSGMRFKILTCGSLRSLLGRRRWLKSKHTQQGEKITHLKGGE